MMNYAFPESQLQQQHVPKKNMESRIETTAKFDEIR